MVQALRSVQWASANKSSLIYRLVEVNDDVDLHGETGDSLSGR